MLSNRVSSTYNRYFDDDKKMGIPSKILVEKVIHDFGIPFSRVTLANMRSAGLIVPCRDNEDEIEQKIEDGMSEDIKNRIRKGIRVYYDYDNLVDILIQHLTHNFFTDVAKTNFISFASSKSKIKNGLSKDFIFLHIREETIIKEKSSRIDNENKEECLETFVRDNYKNFFKLAKDTLRMCGVVNPQKDELIKFAQKLLCLASVNYFLRHWFKAPADNLKQAEKKIIENWQMLKEIMYISGYGCYYVKKISELVAIEQQHFNLYQNCKSIGTETEIKNGESIEKFVSIYNDKLKNAMEGMYFFQQQMEKGSPECKFHIISWLEIVLAFTSSLRNIGDNLIETEAKEGLQQYIDISKFNGSLLQVAYNMLITGFLPIK